MEIAEYLGIHVPPDYRHAEVSNLSYTDDSSKWGVIVRDDEINNLFHDFSIPLREKFLSINLFEDWSFEEKIEELVRSDSHIICGYSANALNSSTINVNPVNLGHAAAILGIEPCGAVEKNVAIYDPGPDASGQYHIRGWHLFAAIKARKDGLWVISGT